VVSTVINFEFYEMPGNSSLSAELLVLQGINCVTEWAICGAH